MGVCRLAKAKKLLFSSGVMPAVVLSRQSVFSKLDVSGKQGLRDQSSLHRKVGSLISAAASAVVLGLFMYCHSLRCQIMVISFSGFFPVCKRLMERCLGSLLKCLFFSSVPRERCIYFSFNLLIRLQNEDSVKKLTVSRPSFVLLMGDINSPS